MEELYDVPGYDGKYKINRAGEIWSFSCKSPQGKKMSPCVCQGYNTIGFIKNKKHVKYKVHRLLALLFIDNPEEKPQINHKDGNKSNNSLSNLEWATAAENGQHAFDTGLSKKTDKMLAALASGRLLKRFLTDEQAQKIRFLRKENILSCTDIAKLFNVSRETIYQICSGRIYKNVDR